MSTIEKSKITRRLVITTMKATPLKQKERDSKHKLGDEIKKVKKIR